MVETMKIGLALGSGAARGLAHIGVLEVLHKEGIPIDMISGTSAGAFIGALYARGRDIGAVKNIVRGLTRKHLISLADLIPSRTGLIQGGKIKDILEAAIGGDIAFTDLKIPFACIATDIMTGEEVVINQGSVLDGVRASISIPLLLSATKLRSRYLVDGGLVNPVPVNILKRMGANIVIAVNVIPNFKTEIQKTEKLKGPNILDIIMHTMYIGNAMLVRHSLEGADISIEPDVRYIGAGDFHRADECIMQGKKAAEESITKIRVQLEVYGSQSL